MHEISTALETEFEAQTFRVHNLFETRRISDIAGAATQWLLSLSRGNPLPLQTIFYSGSHETDNLARLLCEGDFDAIYLDSVRSQLLLRKLRKLAPEARVVVDFDDLMSRRMQNLSARRLGVSLGFLKQLFPEALRWSIEGPLSGLLVKYEGAALTQAEREMVGSAQAVVLVSSTERDLLRQQLSEVQRDKIHAVPPPSASYRAATEVSAPYRFMFIGSDKLVQNELSIDFLLDLWQRLRPASQLHIYGRQHRTNRELPNVVWHGFVENVADAYAAGSIAVLPAILAGGIKTKVIEAWSLGCPVLGNQLAFEGLDVVDYPLIKTESDWESYILDPSAHAPEWTAAARIGNSFVRSTLSRERFGANWRRIMLPEN